MAQAPGSCKIKTENNIFEFYRRMVNYHEKNLRSQAELQSVLDWIMHINNYC